MWNFSSGICFSEEEGSTGSHPAWTDVAVADIGCIPAMFSFSGAGECYSKHEPFAPVHNSHCTSSCAKDKTGFMYLRS